MKMFIRKLKKQKEKKIVCMTEKNKQFPLILQIHSKILNMLTKFYGSQRTTSAHSVLFLKAMLLYLLGKTVRAYDFIFWNIHQLSKPYNMKGKYINLMYYLCLLNLRLL